MEEGAAGSNRRRENVPLRASAAESLANSIRRPTRIGSHAEAGKCVSPAERDNRKAIVDSGHAEKIARRPSAFGAASARLESLRQVGCAERRIVEEVVWDVDEGGECAFEVQRVF